MYEVERKIDVEWGRAASESFPVKLLVQSEDRPGILNQLTTALVNEQTNIRSLEARSDDSRTHDGAIIDVTVEVKDKKQLERVVSAVRRIPGVRDMERNRTHGLSLRYSEEIIQRINCDVLQPKRHIRKCACARTYHQSPNPKGSRSIGRMVI